MMTSESAKESPLIPLGALRLPTAYLGNASLPKRMYTQSRDIYPSPYKA